MNDYEKFVPVECRLAVAAFIETARGLMEKEGELTPVAFVGRFDGGGDIVGGLHLMPKDMTPKIIRAVAKKIDADYVLFVTEVWLKPMDFKTRAEADAFYQRMSSEGGQVRDMPGRIDAVMFQLETYSGQFMANVPREGNEGAYTFGEPKFDLSRESMGRFVGMLPPRGAKQ